jgi:hypothetical protein
LPPKKIKVIPPAVEVRLDSQASYTLLQASAFTGLTRWQLRMAIWRGNLKARRAGKNLIVLREDVEAFLRSLPTVGASSADWLRRHEAQP